MKEKLLIGGMVALFAMSVLVDFTAALLSRAFDLGFVAVGLYLVWQLRQRWQRRIAELKDENERLQQRNTQLRRAFDAVAPNVKVREQA